MLRGQGVNARGRYLQAGEGSRGGLQFMIMNRLFESTFIRINGMYSNVLARNIEVAQVKF